MISRLQRNRSTLEGVTQDLYWPMAAYTGKRVGLKNLPLISALPALAWSHLRIPVSISPMVVIP